jgi:hypothetical protein
MKGKSFSAYVSNTLKKKGLSLPKILKVFRQQRRGVFVTQCIPNLYVAENRGGDFRQITRIFGIWRGR